MSKNFLTFIIISLCLFNLLLSQSSPDTSISDISLRTYVENESVPLNREVIYVVQLAWAGELDRYKISEVLEPDVTNLTVRGSGSSNKVTTNSLGKTISTKKVTFYFKPIEMGMSYVNGVTVRYEDTVLGKKESLLASRIGVQIIDPLPDDSSTGVFQYLFYLIVIAFIIVIGYVFFVYTKRKKENALKELEEIKETTEEKYRRLLKETIHFSGNNFKDKLNELTHLIIGYYSEKYSNPLNNKSTEEVLNFLKNQKLNESISQKTRDFLTKSDLIRFAGNAVTESDFHQFYDSVEWILEKCKKDNSEKEVE